MVRRWTKPLPVIRRKLVRRRLASFRRQVGASRRNKTFIHYFKRTTVQTVVITGNENFIQVIPSAPAAAYNDYRLNQLPNYTDFTDLYDSYRICAIKRKYVFDRNSAETLSAVELPRLITVNDWNDTSALSTEAEALEYASCKITRLDKPTKRYFKPTTIIEDAVQGNAQVQRRKWFDCATGSDQKHLGLKEAVLMSNTNNQDGIGRLHIYTTFYIACRTPR